MPWPHAGNGKSGGGEEGDNQTRLHQEPVLFSLLPGTSGKLGGRMVLAVWNGPGIGEQWVN